MEKEPEKIKKEKKTKRTKRNKNKKDTSDMSTLQPSTFAESRRASQKSFRFVPEDSKGCDEDLAQEDDEEGTESPTTLFKTKYETKSDSSCEFLKYYYYFSIIVQILPQLIFIYNIIHFEFFPIVETVKFVPLPEDEDKYILSKVNVILK